MSFPSTRLLLACWLCMGVRLAVTGQEPIAPPDTAIAKAVEKIVSTDSSKVHRPLSPEAWQRAGDDTLEVNTRSYDQAAIDRYLADDDLDYDRTEHVDRLPWWHWFWRWLERMLGKLFGSKGGRWLVENLYWIIPSAGVIFLIWFFRRRIFANAFAASPTRRRQVTVMEENIEELDLDALLHEAERGEKWAFALRYHYLKVLRRLVDEGKIQWQPRYTDQEYLSQLSEPALRATFSELSFVFKWVWYGDAPLDQANYERLKRPFELFHQRHSQAA